MTAAIILRCKRCGRKMKYSRKADPDLPTNVATIESSACDRCGAQGPTADTWADAERLWNDRAEKRDGN
ncbi:MAG: hypothetical protein E5Y67_12510 [Mesorhizobium sp.]|uniref:hypothetical protein n=1 Tax=Mesorhizobium sp. TaxID=1871066 RepID=UPI00121B0327|nr:hypothetical protein [Mesorhizobium sp.]TIM14494.1 MAG: hypothetical protein E5Y67_12510 [Mesorhizobium sp.]